MPPYPNITLAVMAGGKAQRMGGTNKALLQLHGKTFIEHIIGNLSGLFGETIVISNTPADFEALAHSVYPDIILNSGPLGGIHAALSSCKGSSIFAVSCDMPFASAHMAKSLCGEFTSNPPDILVPKINDKIEPLFAIYSTNIKPLIEQSLQGDGPKSIRSIFSQCNTRYFSFSSTPDVLQSLSNINTPDDLRQIE